MKKLCIIASLILTIPHVLFPAADQVTEQIPQAPGLPPAPAQPVYVLGNNDLTNEDYEYCMELTKEINPKMFAYLERAEKIWGQRCFKIKTDSEHYAVRIEKPSYRSKGYPFFILNPDLLLEKKEPINNLNRAFNFWSMEQQREQHDMSRFMRLKDKDRECVLNTIKRLAPPLHALLIADDPSGKKYILPAETAAVLVHENGVPIICVNNIFINKPNEEQDFIIAHELAHYVLLHHLDTNTFGNNVWDFNILFGMYSKEREYAADTFALQISKNTLAGCLLSFREQDDSIQPPAFQDAPDIPLTIKKYERIMASHPSCKNRIKWLKVLEASNPFSERKLQTINWEKIIEQHQIFYSQKPLQAANTTTNTETPTPNKPINTQTPAHQFTGSTSQWAKLLPATLIGLATCIVLYKKIKQFPQK